MNKLNKKISSVLIFVFLAAMLLTGCGSKGNTDSTDSIPSSPITRTELWLDTPCTITIYDKSSTAILDKAFATLKDIHNKMNADLDSSEVSNINKNAGIKYVKVSDNTFYVIKEALIYSKLTQGKFDISIGPLVKLWGINTPGAHVPAPAEIKARLPLINYENILINESDKSVKLKNVGMAIDLGGIAKGYAGDAVADTLE